MVPAPDQPRDRVRVVLVADDDPFIREALSDVLQEQGYIVVPVEDGREALEKMKHGLRPDVVLLDLMMPVMNGLEVIERVHADERLRDTTIVVVSANQGYSAEDLQVADVVRKPVDLDELLSIVDRAIGSSSP